MARRYGAPWGRSLAWATILSSFLLIGVTVFACVAVAREGAPAFAFWLCASLPLIIIGSALFTIRGYTVDANGLFVHRLLWANQLPWSGLRAVEADPEAMRRGVKTCGNGGLFSFSGRFWSRKLGHYRALVTDPSRAVVLRYEGKTVVVSPDDPGAFVDEVSRRIGRG